MSHYCDNFVCLWWIRLYAKSDIRYHCVTAGWHIVRDETYPTGAGLRSLTGLYWTQLLSTLSLVSLFHWLTYFWTSCTQTTQIKSFSVFCYNVNDSYQLILLRFSWRFVGTKRNVLWPRKTYYRICAYCFICPNL